MSSRKKPAKPNPFYQRVKPPEAELTYPVRLNKYVARCGVCSRRKAVDLVKSGRIAVNAQVVLEPFYEVNPDDRITLDGTEIKPETTRIYILLNKPRDIITTTSDELGRSTVFDLLDFEGKERLFPIGRLDRQTTGLLLLTNDGDLAARLGHPSHESLKEYHVRLDKPLTAEDRKKIADGLILDDGPVPIKHIHYLSENKPNEISISLVIGRNRIVRRVFEQLGYEIQHLDRVYLAGLTKKGLPRGRYRHLSAREVIMLKHFV